MEGGGRLGDKNYDRSENDFFPLEECVEEGNEKKKAKTMKNEKRFCFCASEKIVSPRAYDSPRDETEHNL